MTARAALPSAERMFVPVIWVVVLPEARDLLQMAGGLKGIGIGGAFFHFSF